MAPPRRVRRRVPICRRWRRVRRRSPPLRRRVRRRRRRVRRPSARPHVATADGERRRRRAGKRAMPAAPAKIRSVSASPIACASCRRACRSSSIWRRAVPTSPPTTICGRAPSRRAGQLVDQLSADGSLPAGVEPDALSKDVVQETLGTGPLEELLADETRARDRGGAARSHLRRARGHADAGAQVVQLAGSGRARAVSACWRARGAAAISTRRAATACSSRRAWSTACC